MVILWGIWEIFVNVIEYYFLFFLLSKRLSYSSSRKYQIYIVLFCLVALQSIMNLFEVDYQITMIVMSSLKVFYALLFKGNIGARLFWGVIGSFVAIAANLLISLILTWMSGINISDTLLPSESRFGTTILYCMIIITINWILSRIRVSQHISLPFYFQIFIVAIMILGIFASGEAIAFSIGSNRSSQERIVLTVISAAILAMIVSIIFLFEKIGETLWEKSRLERAHLEDENNKRTEAMVRAWRHDFHNYLEVMQIYIENKDFDQLKKYVGEVKKDFQSILSLVATGNPAVDAIISSKMLIASEKNVQVRLNAQKILRLPISETKLCVVLGNLLDNAIEACSKIPDPEKRHIKIDIYPQRGMLMIHIVNQSSGGYKMKDGQLISTKPEGSHGYGLKRVRQIVNDADGIYNISYTDDQFEVTLFFSIKEAADSNEN